MFFFEHRNVFSSDSYFLFHDWLTDIFIYQGHNKSKLKRQKVMRRRDNERVLITEHVLQQIRLGVLSSTGEVLLTPKQVSTAANYAMDNNYADYLPEGLYDVFAGPGMRADVSITRANGRWTLVVDDVATQSGNGQRLPPEEGDKFEEKGGPESISNPRLAVVHAKWKEDAEIEKKGSTCGPYSASIPEVGPRPGQVVIGEDGWYEKWQRQQEERRKNKKVLARLQI